MKKFFLIISFIVCTIGNVFSQTFIQNVIAIDSAIDEPLDYTQHSIAEYEDGSFVTIGTVYSSNENFDILLTLNSIEGDVIWAQYIDYIAGDFIHNEFAGSVIIDRDSNIVLTGAVKWKKLGPPPPDRWDGHHSGILIAKFDQNGNPLEDIVLMEEIWLDDIYGFDIIQTDDEGYIVVGVQSYPASTINPSAYKFGIMLKIDKNLRFDGIQWAKKYSSTSHTSQHSRGWDSFNSITRIDNPELGEEIYAVTGSSASDVKDIHTLLIDGNGNQLWSVVGTSSASFKNNNRDNYTDYASPGITVLHRNNQLFVLYNALVRIKETNEWKGIIAVDIYDVFSGTLEDAFDIESDEDFTSLFIHGMEWEEENEEDLSIVFAGYIYREYPNTGNPVMFAVDIKNRFLDSHDDILIKWAYNYPDLFNSDDYKNVNSYSEITQPIHSSQFPVTSYFYSPKSFIKNNNPEFNYKYRFAGIGADQHSFHLSLLSTDEYGGVSDDEQCRYDLSLSLFNHTIKEPILHWSLNPIPFIVYEPYRPPFFQTTVPVLLPNFLTCNENQDENQEQNKNNIELNKIDIQLLPNPTQGWVSILASKPIEKITVYNTLGQIVKPLLVENEAIDFSGLTPGLYLVEIIANGEKNFFRIIKN